MLKRDTRVQIIIVKRGKYILLKHHAIKQDIYFWGIPGGGREKGETDEEAAIREAYEETGLKVRLLPIKIEGVPQIKTSIYSRVVTFLAYPIEGIASTGCEPEEEMKEYYRLVDMKWQDFYDEEGLDDIIKNDMKPFLKIIDSDKFVKRDIFIIHKKITNNSYYRILNNYKNKNNECSMENDNDKLDIICNNSILKDYLGFSIRKDNDFMYKDSIYFLDIVNNNDTAISDNKQWYTYGELIKKDIEPEIIEIISDFNDKV